MPSAPKKIGILTSTSLVVANMVGTGVFTSLGFQVEAVQLPSSILLLWLLGGVFALCGALSYAEVAAALPRSGGEYHFLRRIFHPSLGLMAGLTSLVAGFAAPVALAGIALGKYAHAILPSYSAHTLALCAISLVTVFHLLGTSTSSAFQNFFTSLKISFVLLLSVSGFWLGSAEQPWFEFSSNEILQPPFAVSLMFALFAYSGWNAATYIIGEIRDPGRSVAIALLAGTGIVTVLYMLINASFLAVLPTESLRGQLDVGRLSGEALFGSTGGKIVAGMISVGLISSISAMVWTGPRVAMVLGEDFSQLRILSRKTAAGTPVLAVLFQYAITVLLLASGSFETVLVYTQIALVTCSALVVYGVIRLRASEPLLPRPFRCPLYPLPPILFLCISIFTVAYSALHKPLESFAGLLSMAAAASLFFIAKKNRTPHDDSLPPPPCP